jgi:hypothetical protein
MGIDSNNTAYLSYRLELDVDSFNSLQQHNFKEALYQIATHYHTELGFSVDLETDSNPLVFTAEKSIANNSFENAFESLKTMLTDESQTVFMLVDMELINYPRQLGYIMGADLDIPRIIKSNDFDDLPPDFKRNFEDAVPASNGTITITMPGDEVVRASHEYNSTNGQIKMTVPIDFTAETAFELSAKRNIFNSVLDNSPGAFIEMGFRAVFGDTDDSFINQQLRLKSYAALMVFAGIALLVVTVVITVIVLIVKKVKYHP